MERAVTLYRCMLMALIPQGFPPVKIQIKHLLLSPTAFSALIAASGEDKVQLRRSGSSCSSPRQRPLPQRPRRWQPSKGLLLVAALAAVSHGSGGLGSEFLLGDLELPTDPGLPALQAHPSSPPRYHQDASAIADRTTRSVPLSRFHPTPRPAPAH